MNKKRIFILFLLAIAIPALSAINKENLSITLKELRRSMKRDYEQMSDTRDKLKKNYEEQHQQMVDIMKQCNEISLILYSQKQDFTFDISYTLEKVKKEFNQFEKDKMPYDRIVRNLDLEVDRYARLIESLRRLPPELDTISDLADSLLYRNDSLFQHHLTSASQLERTIEAAALDDSIQLPFVLDKQGEQDRDSCMFYAKELLKMYFESKAIVVADSIHYHETYMQLKESYDYANNYYKLLQRRIFVEGQTPWPVILANYDSYWEQAKADIYEKYAIYDFKKLYSTDSPSPIDSTLTMANDSTLVDSTLVDSTLLGQSVNDTLVLDVSPASTETESDENTESRVSKRYEYSFQFFIILFLIAEFFLFWYALRLLLWPVFKFVKPVKKAVSKEQRRFITMLLAILTIMVVNRSAGDVSMVFSKAFRLANTFMWLLAAIVTALLIRLKPDEIKNGFRLYRPTIYLALFVIGCRVLFIPNSLMNIIFPPVLIVFFLWQLLTCLLRAKKADPRDQTFSWISLTVTGAAMIVALMGYIFASLLLLVWWYFQMAAILTMVTIWHLALNYKERRLNSRINDYLENITKVSGQDKKTYLFRVTWFYELVKDVILPIMVLVSFPFCLYLAMDVFDFEDLYRNLFYTPFIHLTNNEGLSLFTLSFHSTILLSSLFFIFRYANHAIHSLWQQAKYANFLRKTHRETIHKDEVNLSLGNSIINFVVWFIYMVIVVFTLQIPTGSLTLVAGGFSAGVGLALKDIINNFIYGIQLMSGRLKVGDWIECDGIRGKVTDINYQTTQVDTINHTTVLFLNSNLFAKNFTNLTKGNSYEFLKILVSVAYGTDVQRVREVIEEAMQVMCTKDEFGRDIVDPRYGVYVRFGEFSESSVNIAVKQYVLASEHIPYTDKAKEVIYNALNENGITIPFPQRDIHIIRGASDTVDQEMASM